MARGQRRDNTGGIDSEAQRWMTLHPASRQESADRRPLLQQSCPDLRIPGSQNHPMHRRRCPRVYGSRSLDTMAPGAALSSSDRRFNRFPNH